MEINLHISTALGIVVVESFGKKAAAASQTPPDKIIVKRRLFLNISHPEIGQTFVSGDWYSQIDLKKAFVFCSSSFPFYFLNSRHQNDSRPLRVHPDNEEGGVCTSQSLRHGMSFYFLFGDCVHPVVVHKPIELHARVQSAAVRYRGVRQRTLVGENSSV